MPNKLRTLSGSDLVSIFEKHGFIIKSQSGSHIKMHNNQGGIILIPNHKEIRKGTLKAIINQSSKYISQEDLQNLFYTE
jgi:predicted RNA binding protein YcfA (HicA-like mRNA interferase family)